MANRRPGGLQIARFQPQAERQPVERINYAAGLGAERQAAQALSGLSARLGQAADEADARRGAEDGARAAFDPEFRRLDQNTAYARAFNARGSQIYLTRLETEVRGRLDKAYLDNRSDPAALETAMTGLRQEYLSTQTIAADPELRAEFAGLFDRSALAYSRRAARSRIEADEANARGAAAELVTLRLNAVERMAGVLGLDEAADGALAGEMTSLQDTLAQYGPQDAFTLNGVEYAADPERAGAYSPAQMQEVLLGASGRVEAARVMGAFERVGGLEAQRAFREQFRDDYAEGRYGVMDRAGRDRLDGAMARSINAAETEADAARRALADRIEDVLGDAEDAARAGLPSETPFAAIEEAANRIGGEEGREIARRAREGAALADFSAQFQTLSPAEMEGAVAEERARLSEAGGANAFEVARVEAAERIFGEARVQSQRDPLAWAARSGNARISPLNAADAQSLGASLSERAPRARAVAGRYGAPVRYFTRAEAAQIGEVVRSGGVDRVAMAGSIIDALGPQEGARALAEVAEEDFELAHVGGLMSVGATAAARDMAEGARLRREATEQGGRAPSYMPPQADRTARVTAVLGDVSERLPSTAQKITQAADLIYEARARREGWDPVTIRQADYDRALHEAAGAVYEDGVRYGGVVGESGGLPFIGDQSGQILAPNWLRADRMEDAIDLIARGDAGPRLAMRDGSGRAIPQEALARATLVSQGEARYLVTFGDQYALTDDGAPFVMDLSAYRSGIARRRPEWVR